MTRPERPRGALHLPVTTLEIENFQNLKGKRYRRDENRAAVAPYGVYHENGGREVLFNRRYQPIYWRDVKKRIAGQDDPKRRIDIVDQFYFRDDGRFNPLGEPRHYHRCLYILGLFLAFESLEPVILRGWEHSIPQCWPPE